MEQILADKDYYEASNGGVTLSGGECMLQIDFVTELLKECERQGINAAIDTAGNVPYEYFERVMPYTKAFLFDLKCVSPDLHKNGTGSYNDLILENLRTLSTTCPEKLVIRIPLIGGFNDTPTELEGIKAFLATLNYTSLEILPYHSMAQHKYSATTKPYTEFSTPTQKAIDTLKSLKS